jgi:hypothetical protein
MLDLMALLLSLMLAVDQIGAGQSEDGIETAFHPYTLEQCTSVRIEDTGLSNCDPVNLVFAGASWEQVREVLQAQGWTAEGSGSRQVILYDGVAVPDVEQLFLIQAAGARYHVRLWQVSETVTLGSVHHEAAGLLPFFHRIDQDWEIAEAFIADQLCPEAKACFSTSQLAGQRRTQDGEWWRGWRNDSRARLIVLG